jgi:hypothetical protein
LIGWEKTRTGGCQGNNAGCLDKQWMEIFVGTLKEALKMKFVKERPPEHGSGLSFVLIKT